ncbi:hypothetical protein BDN70DRAFT_989880 [Pholiota conissans]|uniref:F-box domain-containing protein n=1 Tax=Pholiota conissans TaxID=109636 RepID=A0A9P5ZCR2_9AGAR|nr:hypothetical protein BDN70DRAFT_989880 [Pholiota conissans]
MQTLPTELKGVIAEHLQKGTRPKKNLSAFRLVSKDFAYAAAPSLFRSLKLSRHIESHKSIANVLDNRPNFVNYVKNFSVVVSTLRHSHHRDSIENSTSIISRLNLFSALETMCLRFPDDFDDEDGYQSEVQKLQNMIFEELANLSPKLNALRKLEIHGLITQPNKGLRNAGFRSFLRDIADLHIGVVSHVETREELVRNTAYREFWDKDIVPFLTAPTDLTSFTLISDFRDGIIGPNYAVWDSMNWPKLRTLVVQGFIFNDKDASLAINGLEAFILRHTSLTYLNLKDCLLNVNIPQVPKIRTWVDVFTGFQDGLVNLQKFTTYPHPRRPHCAKNDQYGVSYIHPCTQLGYSASFEKHEGPNPDEAFRDMTALETLMRRCRVRRQKMISR